ALLPFVVGATPALGSATVSLSLAPKAVTYGDQQKASGTVTADAPCAAGRTVDLEQKPAGSTAWTTIDSTTSGSDGRFALTTTPKTNASYRAVAESAVPAGGTCAQLTTSPVAARVVALVRP